MKEPAKLIGALQTLRALGTQVPSDDFGTGYSSVSYLKQLQVDCLKIDRAFVRDLDEQVGGQPIIEGSIDIAQLAEGVETGAQTRMLHALGCD